MPLSPQTADKALLRAHYRSLRQALAPEERARLSQEAARHILCSEAWQNAGSVALYMAVRGETDCAALIQAALALGKTVLLPRCADDRAGAMRFFRCTDLGALQPGAFGIPEPATAKDERPLPDLAVLPGVAFDRAGTRLGAGGGYYDRWLAHPEHAGCLRLGFCYSLQLTESLPRDPWDAPMHAVCTEQGLIWTTQA